MAETIPPRHVRRQEARAAAAPPVLHPGGKIFYSPPTRRARVKRSAARRSGSGLLVDYHEADGKAVMRRATQSPALMRRAKSRRRSLVAKASRRANR